MLKVNDRSTSSGQWWKLATLAPLVAKLETCDGEAISISLHKVEDEPWELRYQTLLAGGLISTSSCIFSLKWGKISINCMVMTLQHWLWLLHYTQINHKMCNELLNITIYFVCLCFQGPKFGIRRTHLRKLGPQQCISLRGQKAQISNQPGGLKEVHRGGFCLFWHGCNIFDF